MEFFYYGSECISTFIKSRCTLWLACGSTPKNGPGAAGISAAVYAALIPAAPGLCHSIYARPDLFSHAVVLFHTDTACTVSGKFWIIMTDISASGQKTAVSE